MSWKYAANLQENTHAEHLWAAALNSERQFKTLDIIFLTNFITDRNTIITKGSLMVQTD